MLLSTRTSNRRSLLGYGLAIWSLLGASFWNQNAVLFATAYVAPPHPETFADFEPVHEMRQRLNITYNYQPKYIHPEHCRYMTEEECREVDESQEKGRKERLRRQRNRRRAKFEDRYGYPVGQKFKALVLLIQFPEDADKVLADPAHITRVLNGTGGWEYSPAGSVREYFRMGSLNQLDVEFEVIPWVSPLLFMDSGGLGNAISDCRAAFDSHMLLLLANFRILRTSRPRILPMEIPEFGAQFGFKNCLNGNSTRWMRKINSGGSIMM